MVSRLDTVYMHGKLAFVMKLIRKNPYAQSAGLGRAGIAMVSLVSAEVRVELSKFASDLCALRLNPHELRGQLLGGLLGFLPVSGPCTLIRLDQFFSEGGRQIAPPHHVNPPDAEILAIWDAHIASTASVIEQRLFARKGRMAVGYARLSDLFSQEEWSKSNLYPLAVRAGVGDMAYLWIRCLDSELWAACLRRLVSEPPFTDAELQLLEEFGTQFCGMQQLWYSAEANMLTKRQLECVRYFFRGFPAKAAAKEMGIGLKTYEKHMENARERLGGGASGTDVLCQLLVR
jgi:hypothetical protein